MSISVKYLLLVLVFFLSVSSAFGVETLFDDPCARFGVPKALALAVAQQESGLRPWVVNVAGKDFNTTSKSDALRVAHAALAAGKSFDVGLMQVNVEWLKRLDISPEAAIEPRANVILGVWILAREIEKHGLNWRAVAYYHTPLHKNPERGRAYAASVIRRIQGVAAQSQTVQASAPTSMIVQRPRMHSVSNETTPPVRTATAMLVRRFYSAVGELKVR